MGQAKKRGTFEERRAKALERKERIQGTVQPIATDKVAAHSPKPQRVVPILTAALIAALYR